MIQQTARPISLEMALRDMIAAGYKVQLSAETSTWFDELYDRIRMGGEIITHETLGLSMEFLDSEHDWIVHGTQLELEAEFAFKELEGPLYIFEMLDTTVFHGKLWSSTMLESHEDVGDEIARLIENVATNYYCSAH